MSALDATHDPALRSWVPGADGHADFPVQNLPFGVFSPPEASARAGVAIGDDVLDLGAVLDADYAGSMSVSITRTTSASSSGRSR